MATSVYSGIKFPPQRTSAGFFAISTDEQLIRESIHVILNTRKGEMPMTPDFGCSAHALLFEQINPITQNIMAQRIKEDLQKWEPRVEVISVDAYSYEHTRYFKLLLRIKTTSETFEVTTNFSRS